MDFTELKVTEICGDICVDPEDGSRLRDSIRAILEQGAAVRLDFTGVLTLTSSFLNSAIGALYEQISVDDLERRLTWVGLDEPDNALVRLVRTNAARFYSASVEQKKRLENSSNTLFDD